MYMNKAKNPNPYVYPDRDGNLMRVQRGIDAEKQVVAAMLCDRAHKGMVIV